MKKLILVIGILVLLAGTGWGATYYIGVYSDLHYRGGVYPERLTYSQTINTRFTNESVNAVLLLGDILKNIV